MYDQKVEVRTNNQLHRQLRDKVGVVQQLRVLDEEIVRGVVRKDLPVCYAPRVWGNLACDICTTSSSTYLQKGIDKRCN
jgi:hypothetical protein